MKTFVFVIALAVLAVPAFGQERDGSGYERRMAVTVNPMPLLSSAIFDGYGIDLGFEYALKPAVSLRLGARFANIRVDDGAAGYEEEWASLFAVSLDGRWYPQQNFISGWFLSAGIQGMLAPSSAAPLLTGEEGDGSMLHAVSFFPGVGHKWVFRSPRRAAFALEGMVDIGFLLTANVPRNGPDLPPSWMLGSTGPRASVFLGAAF